MWISKHHNSLPLFLVVDDTTATLITFQKDLSHHPFSLTSYMPLPSVWFLHGTPWHISSLSTYLTTYKKKSSEKQQRLVCAINSATLYERTVVLPHSPTQAVIPHDHQYRDYAWQTTTLSTADTGTSYLISGIPCNDLVRLRMCANTSGYRVDRITTLRAGIQPVYTYCQQQGLALPDETLIALPSKDLSTNYNRNLALTALGLALFERNCV